MLSEKEALVHARQHLYGRRPPVGRAWVLRAGQRVSDGWYFDYALEPLRFIRDQQEPQFGGAPGFVVSDDGQVRDVSWGERDHLLPKRDEKDVV